MWKKNITNNSAVSVIACKISEFLLIYFLVVPSSSGPGRLVLIQKIKGSTPFGITISS